VIASALRRPRASTLATPAIVARSLIVKVGLIWAAMLLVLAPAAMASAEAIRFPELTGRVVDEAAVLSPEQKDALSVRLKALEEKNGRQLVVVTLKSLQGQEISDYGYQLGRHWGIGQKGQNNGVLLIVAPEERKVRIEVGYGLEPILTDALSSTIIQGKMLPKFRAGDVPGGVIDGADALTEQLGLEDAEARQRLAQATAAQEQRATHHRRSGSPIGALFTLFIVFIVVTSIFRRGGGGGWFWPLLILSSLDRGGRSDGWGGGGGGDNDSFGGGGGSFGGGGSSGSW
jgi:uncharacterized protein